MSKSALLIGASGLIGSECLKLLLEDENFSQVKLLQRRELPVSHPKMEQHIIDFDRIENYVTLIQADFIFCCIGTTTKKVNNNKAEYEKIDRIYPRKIAEIALSNGATHYLIVSSMGADVNSSLFYNKLKGSVEQDILNMDYKAISIFRPSLLVGKRNEKRPAEKLAMGMMSIINPLLLGPLKKFRSIRAEHVAKAMIKVALTKKSGSTVYLSDTIETLAHL